MGKKSLLNNASGAEGGFFMREAKIEWGHAQDLAVGKHKPNLFYFLFPQATPDFPDVERFFKFVIITTSFLNKSVVIFTHGNRGIEEDHIKSEI